MNLIKDLVNKVAIDDANRHHVGRPAAEYLPTIWTTQSTKTDFDIKQHNQDYPRGCGPLWTQHLVSLSGQLIPTLFVGKEDVFYVLRPSPSELAGIKLFDDLRASTAQIRSLGSFQTTFESFCGFELKGLDWSNLFIAGGSVLAALTTKDTASFFNELKASDIDIFLYGLDFRQASRKLCHISEVLRANIKNFDCTYLVERGVGVISFVPGLGSGGRKIQVVLRLSANPAAILAGFDFDQVCLGYDGSEVWLSLRAARALYTGYTVTSGAIGSSFAARVIKYACRGYGVIVKPDHGGRLLVQLLQKLVDQDETSVKTLYTEQLWYTLGNFKYVYNLMKQRRSTLWTHSFSSLVTLASLWKVAHGACRIPELLVHVGNAQSLYGAYEVAGVVGHQFDSRDWMEVLVKLVPSLEGTSPLPSTSVWKLTSGKVTKNVMGQRITMVVILPLHVRANLALMAPSVCGPGSLVQVRGSTGLTDTDGIRMEVCLWHVDARNMWQPPKGLSAQVHQFLVRSSMITAWTIGKVATGAPWLKMRHGRALEQSQRHSANPATLDEASRAAWLRE